MKVGPNGWAKVKRRRLGVTFLLCVLWAAGLSGCLDNDEDYHLNGDGQARCWLIGYKLSFPPNQASLNLSRFNLTEGDLENYSVSLKIYGDSELLLEKVTFAYDEVSSNHTMDPLWLGWGQEFDNNNPTELRFIFNVTNGNDTFMLFGLEDTLWIFIEETDVRHEPHHPAIKKSEYDEGFIIDGIKINLNFYLDCDAVP